VPASDDPADFGRQDAVVIALKAYSIGPMLARIAGLLTPDTAVVTAITGIPWWYFCRAGGAFDGVPVECLDPRGEMLRALDPKHLVGCVVHGSAEVVEPGVIHHTSGGTFILGEIDGRLTPRVQALAAAVEAAGLKATLTARIRDDVWTKLIGNTSYNPVAALTGALMSEINANPALIALIRRMMVEGIAVAEAHGCRMTVSLEDRFALARKLGDVKVSMLQDIERGRPLEIDAIVTAVSELGRKVGVPTPTIDGVEALIRERARHR
jgi:2-dehydropantoate 2-reductase